MNLVLFDDLDIREALLPLTFTRPVADIRIGIFTIKEKWEAYLNASASFICQDYLNNKFTTLIQADNIFINGAVCPNENLVDQINNLSLNTAIMQDGLLLAFRNSDFDKKWGREEECNSSAILIENLWHIFKYNGDQIRSDFALIVNGRTSKPINDRHTIVYGEENIFLEEGASVKAATINTEDGPVYLGRNTEVHEGAIIRGPFALCEGSFVNMGAKIRRDSTVGPYSKVGGEIINSVIMGYSNKSHDGFLGNSVIGEWCNIGAGSNTSNLKNNYSEVKLWNYPKGGFIKTGEKFCGLIMGDHSKSGINTMFNTGTVVGVGTNIFGPGFPRNFVPSFSWGGASGFITFKLSKMLEVAEEVMTRRNVKFTDVDKEILNHIYQETIENRSWER